MAAVLLLLLLLHFLRAGIGVELRVTPSHVPEGGSLNLTCLVKGNNSVVATFEYDDGHGTRIGAVQLSGGQCIDNINGQTCDQQCSCTKDGKSFSWTISSVPKSWDKVRVRCQVNNQTASVSNSVAVSVMYPPDTDPVVSGYDGSAKYTGDYVTLSCTVVGGNPAASLSLSCPGGTTSTSGTLTVTLSNTFHDRTCSCVGTHVVGGYSRTVATPTFIVNIPVTSVTIAPSTTVTVDVGTSTTLTCTTQPHSRPTASVTWYRVVSGQPQKITTNIIVSHDTQNSAQTTTIVLSYVPSKEDNGRTVYCVSDGGWTGSTDTTLQSGRVSLNVRYAPTVRTFAVHYKSPSYKGDTVYLDCIIEGGNPLATLTWTCVDQSNEFSINMSTTTQAISRLNIISITEVYNNRTCTCTATHVGLSPSLTKSAGITVYYPPSPPVLAVDTTHGGRLPWLDRPAFTGILTCTTTAGNPPTTRISWYRNGVKEPGQSARTRRFEPPDKDFNGHTFTCRAANSYTYTKKTDNVSNRLALSVEYVPIITLDESTAYINESQRFSRTCSAEGNPSPTVSWYRGTTLARSNGTLQFSGTDRQDAGTYRCTATARSTNDNLLLQSSKLLSLVVQYGPDVDLAMTNTTENTTNFLLSCTANGVPDKYTFKWTHIFGSTVISGTFDQAIISGSVSTLTIPRVTYQDMGTYVCDVDNGYRGRDGEIVQTRHGVLSVQGSPQAISAQNRYVTEKETSLGISITYISFPEPVNTTIIRADSTVLPRRELSIIVSSVPVTVPFYNKEVSVDGYMVYLNFSDFRIRHQGHYQLYVRNVFDYFYNFEIIIADKPDPPSDLLIDQITQSSVVISWSPGDDNGNPQTFIVTYQNNKGGPPINTTLIYNITSYIANNLDVSTKYDVTVCASNAKGTSDTITTSFITKQGETSFSSSKGPNSPSMALVVVGAILIFISFCVLGFSIFLYRKSRLPSRPVDQQEETPKSVVFSSVLSSEKESDQMPTEENKSHYQELDPSDIQPPSTYECLSRDDDAAIMKYERDNYESLQGDSVKLDYEQLHVDDESKHYLNT